MIHCELVLLTEEQYKCKNPKKLFYTHKSEYSLASNVHSITLLIQLFSHFYCIKIGLILIILINFLHFYDFRLNISIFVLI